MDTSLVETVIKDLKEKLESDEIRLALPDYAGQLHLESIKNQTNNQEDPSGNPYPALGSTYAEWKADTTNEGAGPNLRAGYYYPTTKSKPKAIESMYFRESDSMVTLQMYSNEAATYMTQHQDGTHPSGKKRKWFPTEEDKDSAVQKEIQQKIEQYITEILNRN